MSNRTLLTAEDVSELLQVPLDTLRSWRRRGEGPPHMKLGNLIRYDQAELDHWLELRQACALEERQERAGDL